MQMIGSSRFLNNVQEFIRKSLCSPLHVVGRFFLLFSHRLENLISLVILLLNLSLNTFQTQANILRKPLRLLLRLTNKRRFLWPNSHMEQKFVIAGKLPLISLTSGSSTNKTNASQSLTT
ncbi:hypothetical protein Goklo_024618 [Gossypium klotzschianum]|uniref:Uncharacterized protein n=3 Tax=Gossypium TaxID=3633 RepID=A0A7J8W3V5_9ROSI|nr:hypothetical protein [Gossypium klotzschianum]